MLLNASELQAQIASLKDTRHWVKQLEAAEETLSLLKNCRRY